MNIHKRVLLLLLAGAFFISVPNVQAARLSADGDEQGQEALPFLPTEIWHHIVYQMASNGQRYQDLEKLMRTSQSMNHDLGLCLKSIAIFMQFIFNEAHHETSSVGNVVVMSDDKYAFKVSLESLQYAARLLWSGDRQAKIFRTDSWKACMDNNCDALLSLLPENASVDQHFELLKATHVLFLYTPSKVLADKIIDKLMHYEPSFDDMMLLLSDNPNFDLTKFLENGNFCLNLLASVLKKTWVNVNGAQESIPLFFRKKYKEQDRDNKNLLLLLYHPGIDVNKKKAGCPLLTHMLNRGDSSSLQLILAHQNTNVNAVDANGDTALRHAMRAGNFNNLRTLLTHPDIDFGVLRFSDYAHCWRFHDDAAIIFKILQDCVTEKLRLLGETADQDLPEANQDAPNSWWSDRCSVQ